MPGKPKLYVSQSWRGGGGQKKQSKMVSKENKAEQEREAKDKKRGEEDGQRERQAQRVRRKQGTGDLAGFLWLPHYQLQFQKGLDLLYSYKMLPCPFGTRPFKFLFLAAFEL